MNSTLIKAYLLSAVYVGIGSLCLLGLRYDFIFILSMTLFLPINFVSFIVIFTIENPLLWVILVQLLMFYTTKEVIYYFLKKNK